MEESRRRDLRDRPVLRSGPDEQRMERFSTGAPSAGCTPLSDGAVVGGGGAFTFDLSVPGGSLRCGGVTVVGVYPTHRRRGVLRAVMDAQLRRRARARRADRCAVGERGDDLRPLRLRDRVVGGRGEDRPRVDRVRAAARAEGADAVRRRRRRRSSSSRRCGTRCGASVPACSRARRSGGSCGRLRMPDEEKANPKRFVVLDLDGETQGYAVFRHACGLRERRRRVRAPRSSRRSARRRRRRRSSGASCSTSTGRRRSRRICCRPIIRSSCCWRARAARGIGWATGCGCELVDVEAALSGRAYAGDGSIVFDVRDAVCPWNEGRWKLEGGARRAYG